MTGEAPSQPPPRLEDVQSELRQAVQEVVAQLQRDLLEASARLQAEIRQELQHQRAGFCELMDSAQPQEPPGLRTAPRQTVQRTIDEGAEDGYSSSDSDDAPELLSTPSPKKLRAQTEDFLDVRTVPDKKDSDVKKASKEEPPHPTKCACGNIFMADAVYCRKCGARRADNSKETEASRSGTLSKLVSNRMKKKLASNRMKKELEGKSQGQHSRKTRHTVCAAMVPQASSIDPRGVCIQRKKEATNPYLSSAVHPPTAPAAPAGAPAPPSSGEPAAPGAATAPAASAASPGTLAGLALEHRPQVDEAAGAVATATAAPAATTPPAVRSLDAAGSCSSSSAPPPAGTVSAGLQLAPAQPGVVSASPGGTPALLTPAPLGGAPALAQPGPDMAGGVQPHNISFHESPFLLTPGPDTGAGDLNQGSCDEVSENVNPHLQQFSFSPGQSGVTPVTRPESKPRKTGEVSQKIASQIVSAVSKAKSRMSFALSKARGHSQGKACQRVVPTDLQTVSEENIAGDSIGQMSTFRNATNSTSGTQEQDLSGHESIEFARMSKQQFHVILWEVLSGHYSFRFVVARLIGSGIFDYLTTFFVALNACSIGAQTDWEVRHIGQDTPQSYKIIETFFCVIFSTELFLRIYSQRCQFFRLNSGWRWNLFDIVVVGMQILDLVFSSIVGSEEAAGDMSKKFSFIRILRILRLVRIIRVVRILRFIRELRMMVCSIANSLRSLMWTIILIFLMIYVVAVYLTQLVSDHGRYYPETVAEEMPLKERYGSIWRSILTLFQAMTGGVDWEDLSNPLMDNISPLLGLVFVLYIAFAVLAMMNVVTAVFIESALLRAKEDKESELSYHMRNLMSKVDTDGSGMLSWDTFQYLMSDGKMQRNFRALELDIGEAKGLFNLLDIEGKGMISAEEFVTCCLQLRGPAKAIDVATLLYHNRRMSCRWKAHSRHVEAALEEIMDNLYSARPARSRPPPTGSIKKDSSASSGARLNRDSNFASWEELKREPKDLS